MPSSMLGANCSANPLSPPQARLIRSPWTLACRSKPIRPLLQPPTPPPPCSTGGRQTSAAWVPLAGIEGKQATSGTGGQGLDPASSAP
eukprot:scaffold47767_cov36-Tisochrysis_lutea.AAC.4